MSSIYTPLALIPGDSFVDLQDNKATEIPRPEGPNFATAGVGDEKSLQLNPQRPLHQHKHLCRADVTAALHAEENIDASSRQHRR